MKLAVKGTLKTLNYNLYLRELQRLRSLVAIGIETGRRITHVRPRQEARLYWQYRPEESPDMTMSVAPQSAAATTLLHCSFIFGTRT